MVGTVTYDIVNPDTSTDEWRCMKVIVYCKGDNINGSVPDKLIEHLAGWRLHTISAWPKNNAITPSISDVYIRTPVEQGSEDLLGDSVDRSGNGVGLLSPNRRKTTFPIISYPTPMNPLTPLPFPLTYTPQIRNNLILQIKNQTIPSAEWYIELSFCR